MENYLSRKKLWLLFVFVLTTAFYVYAGVKLATQEKKQQEILADSLTAHVNASLADYVLRNDLLALNGYIQDVINQQSTIQKIEVTSLKDEVIAEAGSTNFAKAYTSSIEPVKGQSLGNVTLWLPESEQEGQLWLFLLWLAMSYGLSRLWKLPDAYEADLNSLNKNSEKGSTAPATKTDVIDEQIEETETEEQTDIEEPEFIENNRPNPTYAFISPIIDSEHQRIYSNKSLERVQQLQMDSLNKAALLYHAEVKPMDDGYVMLELPFNISEEQTALQMVSCVAVYFETLKSVLEDFSDISFEPNHHNAVIHHKAFEIKELKDIEHLPEQSMSILLNVALHDWPALKERVVSKEEFDILGQGFVLCQLSDGLKQLIFQQADTLLSDE